MTAGGGATTEPARTGVVTGAGVGLVAGAVAGLLWWLIELGANRAFGGVLSADVTAVLLQLDLALGAAGGLLAGVLTTLVLGRPRATTLALGLSVVYALLRVYSPPGFKVEALMLVAGVAAVAVGSVVAAHPRDGVLAFVRTVFVTTAATVLAMASTGQVQSTYFAFQEARGATLVAMLAALPVIGVAVDRILGVALRSGALRLAVEVGAALVAMQLWGRPMAVAPLVDPIVTGAPPAPGTPDVIIVSLDTTRADRMSTYGYTRDTAPSFTALAKDALNFERCISPAQWTVPGHASMLTGLYPTSHGAHYVGGWTAGPKIGGRQRVFPLAAAQTTLAEILRDHGFSTGGFVANFANLDRGFGFAQGFNRYEDAPALLLRPMPHAVRFAQQFVPTFAKAPFRSTAEISTAALDFLDRAPKGRPAFLFLNLLEPHHWLAPPPYDRWSRELPDWRRLSRKGLFTHAVPAGLSKAEEAFVSAAYDGQILNMDAAFGAFITGLQARGRYENALIVVTADHGELLGEHDIVGHGGRMMYEGLLHVPLIVKLPGATRARGTVKTLVQTVDVVPTVLTALGMDVPAGVQGHPLQKDLPAVRAIVAEEHVNPEFVAHYGAVYDRALRVLYDGSYKLIASSRGERWLFDLARDPAEDHDLAAREPERVTTMAARLDATLQGFPAPAVAARWSPAGAERLAMVWWTHGGAGE